MRDRYQLKNLSYDQLKSLVARLLFLSCKIPVTSG